MANVTARFLDILRRNLKSDAVPKPPRQDIHTNEEVHNEIPRVEENEDPQLKPEEILIEDTDESTDNYKHKSKPFFKANKTKNSSKDYKPVINDINDPHKNVTINTQAAGNVVNILNSKGVHCGNTIIYNLGRSHRQPSRPYQKGKDTDEEPEEDIIQKDNLITLLLEAVEEVEYEYMDFISKNLGRNWRSFFIRLGYTKGRIETFEYDEAKNGIAEVRYKLLLEWVRNDADPSLGHLTTMLWEEGEREIVKALSLVYKKNKKL